MWKNNWKCLHWLRSQESWERNDGNQDKNSVKRCPGKVITRRKTSARNKGKTWQNNQKFKSVVEDDKRCIWWNIRQDLTVGWQIHVTEEKREGARKERTKRVTRSLTSMQKLMKKTVGDKEWIEFTTELLWINSLIAVCFFPVCLSVFFSFPFSLRWM